MASFAGILKHSLPWVLILAFVAGGIAYLWTAPPLERQEVPAKILFSEEVYVRRKPSDEARPWAIAKDGTRLEVLGEQGEWLEVRLDARTTGWVRRNQGRIIPPPWKHPTSRQQAKMRLQQLGNILRQLF